MAPKTRRKLVKHLLPVDYFDLWNQNEAQILEALENHVSIAKVEMAFGFAPGQFGILRAADTDLDVKIRKAEGKRAIKDGQAIAKQIDGGALLAVRTFENGNTLQTFAPPDGMLAMKVRERLEPESWQPSQKIVSENQTTHVIMSEDDAEKI